MLFTDFPTWAYGPEGKAEIFQRAEDIPEGWVDSPAAALALQTGGEEIAAGLRTEAELKEGAEHLRAAIDADIVQRFTEEDDGLPPVVAPPAVDVQEDALPPLPAKTVRKLGKIAVVPPPGSEGVLSPAVRADALSALRGSGVEIKDSATDGEIVSALESLED